LQAERGCGSGEGVNWEGMDSAVQPYESRTGDSDRSGGDSGRAARTGGDFGAGRLERRGVDQGQSEREEKRGDVRESERVSETRWMDLRRGSLNGAKSSGRKVKQVN
jgi:hypothetical protein